MNECMDGWAQRQAAVSSNMIVQQIHPSIHIHISFWLKFVLAMRQQSRNIVVSLSFLSFFFFCALGPTHRGPTAH
jgi:hypothetical protein